MSQESYPSAAYVLSIIAGLFIILGGFIMAAIGAVVSFFAFGVGAIYGLLGIIWGVIILFSAINLRSHPEQRMTWGVIILIFSIVSWFGGLGGLLIGFLLGLLGGILALTWHPTPPVTYTPYTSTPPFSPPPVGQPTRYCSNCGAPVPADATYCSHCGKQLNLT